MGDGHDVGHHDVDRGSSRAVSPGSEFDRKAFLQVKVPLTLLVGSDVRAVDIDLNLPSVDVIGHWVSPAVV
jgi:hypothetical protein